MTMALSLRVAMYPSSRAAIGAPLHVPMDCNRDVLNRGARSTHRLGRRGVPGSCN